MLFYHGELFHMASSRTTYRASGEAFAILNVDRSLDFPSAAESSVLLCLLTIRFY